MITKENKDLAVWAMEYALQQGCQASRVTIYNASSNSVDVRDMKIDNLQQTSEYSLLVHLFVDGRFGSYSTNRLDRNELESFIAKGVRATRFLSKDEARTLPDSSLYYKGGGEDLLLFDPTFETVSPDQRIELAMQVCEEVMGKDARVISTNSSYGDSEVFKYMVVSNGFEGEAAENSFSLSANVCVRGDGEARPQDFWYDSSLFYADLQKTGIGAKALERTLRKLGQKKISSGKYVMLADNFNSARMFSPLVQAMYGSSIQQRCSFLLDKLNTKIVGENVSLKDAPHMLKTAGARYFDSEGIATRPRSIIEKGVLNTYFIDTYAANKMNVLPTIGGPSVLTMDCGVRNAEDIIKDIDKGIYVVGLNGGNCNSTSGDFSYGIEGFLIEKGELTQPISEMNITGNILNLNSHILEIGNDYRTTSSWRIPSLLFDQVDFSGF